ncbi:WD40 repeat-like protein [Aureobasidium pullulans]|uniref:Mitochondrial division protein 1 n=1 Tax=Aureobasidium pullulans TaxID=5580 RepID=A0A4S9DPZ4_AURPU|nr:WD40 repeat-like protein [Aureobasidium pullulans]
MATTKKKLTHEDYVVGWICPMRVEYTAALSMLDEEHETLRQDIADENIYTLGSINGHNVALATLPKTGNSPTARVMTNMSRTFQALRFYLLVGIGGGIPVRTDDGPVRLGDVVVSEGVIQHDRGKFEASGFKLKGTLAPPPQVLLAATNTLLAKRDLTDDDPLLEHLSRIDTNKPRLKRYRFPGRKRDHVYEPSYTHLVKGATCDEAKCDPTKRILRGPSDETLDSQVVEQPDITIHQGTILSGETVMKNGAQRDAVAKPLDAICYECEAAGAMSSVPCLVVRGISDYADSHKNDDWHGFGSAVAAAYARQLFFHLPIDKVKECSVPLQDIADIKEARQMISQKLALLDDHSLKEATFDSYDERKNNQCLRGTRVDLLADIQDWSISPQSKCIFWLNGIAGAGKSTISRSVADQFDKAECLGANFFFKRGDGDRANAKKLFPTLARQLARHVPGILGKLLEILEVEPDIPSKSLREQFEKLIYQPLVSVQDNGAGTRTPVYVIVLDALDECNDASDIRTILRLIVLFNDLEKLKLRVFVTSRPELPIQHEFQDMQDKIRQVVILHNIPQQIIASDIEAFFRSEFEELVLTTRHSDRKPPDWPGDKTICKLVDMAVPLFIFAFTVCRFVKDPTRNPEYQLQAILKQRHRNSKLDATYRPVLKQMYLGRDKEDQRQWASDFRRVVGVIITVFEPLSIASLESLLRPDDFDIPRTLAALHSVLDISESTKRPIRLFHLSFRDYLIDPDQCPEAFLINEPASHVQIAAMCVQMMTRHLRRDLCRLQKPGTMRSQVGQETLNEFIPAELRYACRYWTQHADQGKNPIYDGDHIHNFLNQHMLHWLEALALMGDLAMSIEMFDTIFLLAKGAESTQIRAFVHDAKRFVLRNQYIIDKSPLQTYYSALMFSPTRSIIRQKFWRGAEWLKVSPVVEDNWDACLQTLEGHSNGIEAICFSPDGKLLASASEGEIRLWKARTGVTHSVIQDDLNIATAITFSPDNRLIVSARLDGDITLRDLGTQEVSRIFTGHSGKANAIIFLSNGELLASASDDHTVRLWNTATGLAISLLEGHTDSVEILAASQDGKSFASGSRDGEIRLWDAVVGKLRCVLKGHSTSVQAVAFMHDYTIIASADKAGCINFWEASTGALRNKLDTRRRAYKSTFSPDGKLLAVVEAADSIKFLDTVTGSLQSVLVGHGESVFNEFSPDGTVLASGSFQGTVKLWDIPTAFNHDIVDTPYVYEIAISPRGTFMTSYQADSIKLWNTHTGRLEVEGHAVAFNQNEDMVACALHNHTVNLQNLKTGAPPLSLDGHTGLVPKLAFSPDNKLLASVSSDQTVRLWDIETGALCRKFSCTHKIMEVVFSPNGKLLAIVLRDDTVELWNIATGTPHWAVQAPEGLKNVVFSRDGMILASKSEQSGTWVSCMWDTATKDQIELDSHEILGETFAFSPSSELVAFVSGGRVMKLWDVTSGAVNNMFGGVHGSLVKKVVFSPDGRSIASAGYTDIMLWDVESRALVDRLDVDPGGPFITSVSFSPDGRHLKSNLGYHRLQTNDPSCSYDRSFLSIKKDWVFYGTTPFLWLPADFRPSTDRDCFVGIATVAIARGTGQTAFMTFDMTELERLFSL